MEKKIREHPTSTKEVRATRRVRGKVQTFEDLATERRKNIRMTYARTSYTEDARTTTARDLTSKVCHT